MIRRGRLLPPLALAAACGGPAAPPGPPVLGWETVEDTTVVYAFGDTAVVEVDAAGETLEATVATGMKLDAAFTADPEGVTVSATLRDVAARATNPMAAPRSVRSRDIDEPLVFSLDRRGESTVVSSPEIGAEVGRFLSPEAIAATLFPRLPGGPIHRGSVWTDTVRVDASNPEITVRGTSVLTYTVAGDTTIDGRYLVRVTVQGEDHRELSGSQADMPVTQTLDGSSEGWFFWELARGLLRESVYDSELVGTMEVEAAPVPLALRVRSRTELRIVDPPVGG